MASAVCPTGKLKLRGKEPDASVVLLAGLTVLHNNEKILSYSQSTLDLTVPRPRRPDRGAPIYTNR